MPNGTVRFALAGQVLGLDSLRKLHGQLQFQGADVGLQMAAPGFRISEFRGYFIYEIQQAGLNILALPGLR
ncbi:hypothetical protein [Lacisediminimonas sp.]|uniref:hypothetical protein n=1 Tax=Lacisediminimonas sp. TaxID=3060582 RepID=UPI00272B89B6|nr:hypothetical protein [Lacisediminimonas sp.]